VTGGRNAARFFLYKLFMFMIKIKIKNNLKYLYERQTDILYASISNWFYDLLKDPKDFFIDKFTYKYKNKELGYCLAPGVSIYGYLRSGDDKDWQEAYRQYKEKTKDDGIIVLSLDHFIKAMQDLYILILPKIVNPQASGDMSHYGTMRVFLKTWNVNTVLASKGEEIKNFGFEEDSLEWFETLFGSKVNITLEKAKEGIEAGRFADYIENTLSHEIVHYLNAIRSSGKESSAEFRKRFRTRGGEKQFVPKTKEYASSTEEIQSRLGEVFYYMHKALKLKFPDIEHDLKAIDNGADRAFYEQKYKQILLNSSIPQSIIDCLLDIKNENLQSFYKHFSVVSRLEHYLELMSEKSFNRYKKRVVSFYQEYKDKKDLFPIFKVLDRFF